MFDSVIRPKQNRRSSWGAGVTIAVLVHASSLVLTVYLSRRAPADTMKHEVVVAFVKAPPPPPPPPPPAKKPPPKRDRFVPKAVPKPDVIVQPKETPPEPPAEEEADDEGVEGGVEGGVAGGVVGGVLGGVVQPPPPPPAPAKRIELPDSSVLTKLSGPDPEYTQQALDREIEGVMMVKCTLTADGLVRNCHVLKSLPFMDRATVSALERRRYKPWVAGGSPVEVDVTFKVVLKLPPR